MKFKVDETKGGDPSWWLYGDNGIQVAWAGETFASVGNVRK